MSWDIFRKAIEQLLKDGKFIKLGKNIIVQMIKKHDNGKVTVYVGSALSKDEQDKIKEDPSQMLKSISQNYEDLFDLADQYDFDINNANIIQGFADHKPGRITTKSRIHYYLLYFKLYKYFKECDSALSDYERLIRACKRCGFPIITEEYLEELALKNKTNSTPNSCKNVASKANTHHKSENLPKGMVSNEAEILRQGSFPKVINISSSIHLESSDKFKELVVDALHQCPIEPKIQEILDPEEDSYPPLLRRSRGYNNRLVYMIPRLPYENTEHGEKQLRWLNYILHKTLHSIYNLLITIPIYLVNEDDFDEIMPPAEEEYLVHDSEERAITRKGLCYYCGCYIHKDEMDEKKIYLCPERIKKEYSDIPLWGYVSVCVHEFGHAYMDVAKYNADPSLLKYVEEPFANLFLLSCANKCHHSFFDFVTKSIEKQPIQYRFANKLFNGQPQPFINFYRRCTKHSFYDKYSYSLYHLWAILKDRVDGGSMRGMKDLVFRNYEAYINIMQYKNCLLANQP